MDGGHSGWFKLGVINLFEQMKENKSFLSLIPKEKVDFLHIFLCSVPKMHFKVKNSVERGNLNIFLRYLSR